MGFKLKTSSILSALYTTKRRSRDEIFINFRGDMQVHASMINAWAVERLGLIDYESSPHRKTNYESDLCHRDRLIVSDLTLNSQHIHRYLLCRLVAGSYQLTSTTATSVMTLVEDPEGTVERLTLNNWGDPNLSNAATLASRRCIPIGTILVIRNPKYIPAPDGFPRIVAESPQDVIILNNRHPILYSISWKCPSIRSELHVSPKLTRFAVRPEQYRRDTPGSSNVVLTPIKTAGSTKRNKEGHHDGRRCKKEKKKDKGMVYRIHKNKKKVMKLVRRHSTNTMERLNRDNNAILFCCFVFFVWYVFFSNAI